MNRDIAKILYEMAALYEMNGVPFKPRAYERAASEIEGLGHDIRELYKKGGSAALRKIPGVGQGIAEHIGAIVTGKTYSEYKKLKKKTPVNISELISVEGVGPRTIKVLWEKLRIRDLSGLEKAARDGSISKLPHFGEKSAERILKGIGFLKSSGGRQALGHVFTDIRRIEKLIQAFPEVDDAVIAGSVRRRKETIGDIDILVTSKNPAKVMERFLDFPFIRHVYSQGNTKTMVRLDMGLDADIRVVSRDSYGAALNYFTGSKAHNVALRELAVKKGRKLNEYGLYKGKMLIAGRTEEEVYKKLGLQYIVPELREGAGEIDAARRNGLPNLIGYGDLMGDLQVQTDWTDGENSIKEMAHAAIEAGLEYIVITDHTKSLAVTRGADEEKLMRQAEEIKKINASKKFGKFKILTGAEVNITKDGLLDIADSVLAKLDVVGVSVHSHFNLPRVEQTRRVIRAMENPNADIVFHLTGRLINKREAIDIDVEEVIQAAKRTGTVLEINAFPDRLDIKDEYIRACIQKGVKMSIDSDAHSIGHFGVLEFGVAQARRGWAEKKDIINAWPVEKMLASLKQ